MHLNEKFILSQHESAMTHAEIFIEQVKKTVESYSKGSKRKQRV